jgi:hypothetical protein
MADTRKPRRERSDRGGGGERRGSARSTTRTQPPRRPAQRTRDSNAARGTRGQARPVKGAAARRAAEKRRRRRTLLYSLVTVGVLGALVAFVIVANREDAGPTDEEFKRQQQALAPARQAAGCSEIRQLPNAGGNHIAPDAQPSNWNSNPPTSGDHLAASLTGDFYQTEQDPRLALHSLEHGYVAIQYKNLAPDDVAKLRQLQGEYRGRKLIVMPYSGLETDGVAFAAWQHLQTCSALDVQLAKAFIDAYMVGVGNRSVAPEPFAQ